MFPGTLVLYYFQSYLSGTSPTASQRFFFPQGKNESLPFLKAISSQLTWMKAQKPFQAQIPALLLNVTRLQNYSRLQGPSTHTHSSHECIQHKCWVKNEWASDCVCSCDVKPGVSARLEPLEQFAKHTHTLSDVSRAVPVCEWMCVCVCVTTVQ